MVQGRLLGWASGCIGPSRSKPFSLVLSGNTEPYFKKSGASIGNIKKIILHYYKKGFKGNFSLKAVLFLVWNQCSLSTSLFFLFWLWPQNLWLWHWKSGATISTSSLLDPVKVDLWIPTTNKNVASVTKETIKPHKDELAITVFNWFYKLRLPLLF